MNNLRQRESWYSRTKKELEEMDYKEKYEKALEWMKSVYSTMQGSDKEDAEHYFPELAESEDERIRKELIFFLKEEIPQCSIKEHADKLKEFVSYLEKQKEQKPRDYRKLYEEVVNSDWFKENYVGKSLGEEQKPEWSEADEVYLEDALWCVDKAEKSCKDEDDKGACWAAKRWLKSLRPVSKDSLQSWKPSEAHLSALLAVFNDPNNIGSQTCQLALTDLYEQLNKL